MSKTIKIITEFEVPDDFEDLESLVAFVDGTMDNAPEPEVIDEVLKDVEIGFSYIE